MHAPRRFAAPFRVTAAVSVVLAGFSTALAQITVPNTTFPAAGDTLKMAIDYSPSVINVVYTPPGFDQAWNLSSLHADVTKRFIYRPAGVGTVAAQVPGAELVMTTLPGSGEYYYNVTSTDFELQAYYGIEPYDVVASQLFPYIPPLRERAAPLNFFDIRQSSSGVLKKLPPSAFPPALLAALPVTPDSLRYRVAVSRLDAVDASGTLTIPDGAYSVLRQKRTEYRETRLDGKIPVLGWLDITDIAIQAGFDGLGVDTDTSFDFFNNVQKTPIASVLLNNQQNAAERTLFKYTPPPTSDTATVPRWQARLHQNQPNPFNPTTTIAFELAAGGPVRCTVYDVHGRQVATLLDRFASAGPHRVSWNGTTDGGIPMPSGVYSYKLEGEGWVFARKMVLAR